MAEEPIGQRIKFLITSLGLSVRKFAHALDVGETNIRNYLDRGTKPSSDILEKIILSFPQVNMVWLLTSEGEPFITNEANSGGTQTGNFNQTGTGNIQKVKGNKNNVQTNNGDHATITNNVKLDDCQRELKAASEKIEMLTSQLADKERTIQILLKQTS